VTRSDEAIVLWPKLIRSYRRQLGLTQQRLADILGLSDASISHWESGRITPSEHNRECIAMMVEIPVDLAFPALRFDLERAPSEIIYGPAMETDGSRVTRLRHPNGSTFTVRIPQGGVEQPDDPGISWITDDDPVSVAASDRLLADVFGSSAA